MAGTRVDGPKSTTADALLGLLSMGPMSGYEIRSSIESSIGNFWTESFGQIYPTLKRLTAEGLVTMKADSGEGRAERKVYRLTEAGEERLREWLEIPSQRQVPRNELLLKLFFSGLVPVEFALRQMDVFGAQQQQRLTRYAEIAATLQKKQARHPHLPYWMATVSYGRHEAEALLAWSDETKEMLERLPRRKLRVVTKRVGT